MNQKTRIRGAAPTAFLVAAALFMLTLTFQTFAQNRTQPGGTPPAPGPVFYIVQNDGAPLMIYDSETISDVCYVEPTPELKARLSPEEWDVLVNAGTEAPFENAFWDNHEEGVYVDRIDGTPLFASTAKFESGTGWPSFWKPIDPGAVVLSEDRSYGMRRIEVRSKKSGGHLGHLFPDGPEPTGMRYCINSASLRFVPRGQLGAEGYPSLESLFRP